MSTISIEPLLHHRSRSCSSRSNLRASPRSRPSKSSSPSLIRCSPKPLSHGGRSFCRFEPFRAHAVRASSSGTAAAAGTVQSEEVLFKETFPLKRTVKEEGKIFVRLDHGKDGQNWQLTVGCSLPGKWILHWGVSYIDDVGSEWDQPPDKMRPPGSVPIKDYAIETPLMKPSWSSSKGDMFQEVKIDCQPDSGITAINFVLKDEETGAWYQHKGRDFKVPLLDSLPDDGNMSNSEVSISESADPGTKNRRQEGFYEEQPIAREVAIDCSVSVSLRKCPETAKNLLYLEADVPGDVVVHWGVCRDEAKNWEIPAGPYPPETKQFKSKALRTLLQPKEDGSGSAALFTLGEDFSGFLFVLKLNENSWLNCMGKDFYIPLSSASSLPDQQTKGHFGGVQTSGETAEEKKEDSLVAHTSGIIDEIRSLVSDISFEKNRKTKTKEAQESILQEIEKLAAEAYSIFRASTPTFSEEKILESEEVEPPVKISSGTGSGFEILCQGFNWESHKSGRWYVELKEKATELASLGITVIWLPPPTESVSPEGYMPKDLYNLNSRYGSMDQLKDLVKKFHEVGITVLGDVVLNHRCAHYKNKNGIWNIFGGRLNWDDRAVVADDPHFQGRGNKSSGDFFHAAPNIDHSQDFVRNDIKEWLLWLRKEIGYDGWRLDFVRGFWGGYVKDYLDASEPYFAVGEYWDSLSYTYGEMDHDQDPHRQRIIDWINATGGTAGAFDVTTKGILHTALEKCEYWRLSDKKGKPPGVVGWWPSRAVTFIENHDTGSTQGHWRFPSGKEMQGYAYILTHPGTPSVFYDHIFSHYRSEIAKLISMRNRNKIHCRSTVKITKAERDVYAAMVDDKVAVKIGPGHYEPPSGPRKWSLAAEGRDYKVWETS